MMKNNIGLFGGLAITVLSGCAQNECEDFQRIQAEYEPATEVTQVVAVDKEGIEIPFPQMDVWMKKQFLIFLLS